MGDFFLQNTAFYNGKCYILGGRGWGLNFSGQKYQKAHPSAKSGRVNRLVYVTAAMFKRYTASRKKERENAHWNFESSITLRRYRAARMKTFFFTL